MRKQFPKRLRGYLLTAAAGLGIALIFFYPREAKLYRQQELLMGTLVEVISPDERAPGIVFSQMRRLEKLFSRYDRQSEVSRLNRTGHLKASPETFYIIKRSGELWEASSGAFDITVAPLADLWGFTDRRYKVPAEAAIKDTLRLVGFDKIILRDFDNVIQFKFPGMKIDLGGAAKGYALDLSAQKLKAAGIDNCLINAGGQVFCLGKWKVGIMNPRGNDLAGDIELKDQSAATSGDYERYFISGGKRYAHILDPRSGCPADAGIGSVTVIARDGLTADALSTAIFVLGKDKGEKLARQFSGVEVKITGDPDV
ncbi:MAG: FAD:protein FMN transferase [Candidatus Omnitrophota bacterium]